MLLAQTATGLVALTGCFAPMIAGVALMVPMGVDWMMQYAGVLESTNVRRFITGVLGGAGYMTILVNVPVIIGTRMLQRHPAVYF